MYTHVSNHATHKPIDSVQRELRLINNGKHVISVTFAYVQQSAIDCWIIFAAVLETIIDCCKPCKRMYDRKCVRNVTIPIPI
jgi:hypothetical protein